VIDGIDEARSDGGGHGTVRYYGGIVGSRAQGFQITFTKGLIDALELLRFRTTFFFARHTFAQRLSCSPCGDGFGNEGLQHLLVHVREFLNVEATLAGGVFS
jgi:hypothetical protein